jgi:hypothetical protein
MPEKSVRRRQEFWVVVLKKDAVLGNGTLLSSQRHIEDVFWQPRDDVVVQLKGGIGDRQERRARRDFHPIAD